MEDQYVSEDEVEGQPGTEPETTEERKEAELAFKYGEKEYPKSEVERIIKDYENDTSWKKKNTEEAMTIAEKRRELQKAAQLEEYLNNHPEQYAKVEALFKENQQPGSMQMPPEVQQQLDRMQKLEMDLTTQNAAIELKNDMADLKERYAEDFKATPDLEKQVIDFALKRNVMDLEVALRYVLFDKAKESGLKQGQQKLRKAQDTSQRLGMPKGSRLTPDLKKDIMGTKKTGTAMTKYLDEVYGPE